MNLHTFVNFCFSVVTIFFVSFSAIAQEKSAEANSITEKPIVASPKKAITNPLMSDFKQSIVDSTLQGDSIKTFALPKPSKFIDSLIAIRDSLEIKSVEDAELEKKKIAEAKIQKEIKAQQLQSKLSASDAKILHAKIAIKTARERLEKNKVSMSPEQYAQRLAQIDNAEQQLRVYENHVKNAKTIAK